MKGPTSESALNKNVIADPMVSQNSPHMSLTRLFGRERKELPCALALFYAPIAIGLQIDNNTSSSNRPV
jgi:hypothetical protein